MKLRTVLLAGAVFALAAPAHADDDAVMKRLDKMQKMIEAQQHQIATQNAEIGELRRALGKKGRKVEMTAAAEPAPAAAPAPVEARLAKQQAQIDQLAQALDNTDTAVKLDKQDRPVWSFANGRPTVTSPDGRFSLSLRLLGQFDAAYYMQSNSARILPNGPDLSSGANFRRAQIGFQGKLFGDWSYFFNTEFGGSGGTEGAGRVQSLYIEYDGLHPFALRVGAYPPPGGLEDNTSSADTIFLERAGPSDVMRNTVGGDGRDAVSLIYAGDSFFAAASLTGGKVADPATFDDQNAVLARVSDSLYSDSDSRLVLSASGAYVFKVADSSPIVAAPHTFSFSASPELTVDSSGSKLIATPAIDAKHIGIYGVEAGWQWQSFYAQGGYFHYTIDPRLAGLADQNFDGWYAQATFVLTGESRGYSSANGAFTSPKPRVPFSLDGGGWGAWEMAARYDDTDFNDDPGAAGSATPPNGVRGGDQRIFTLGLNWYPNSVLRFAFDWQTVDVNRLGSIVAPPLSNVQIGQHYNVVSMRSQISL
ncbi:MAG TPA: porin [Rhizomicrobium sp.]|jgi:phosphate-selective porin OprO/OprP